MTNSNEINDKPLVDIPNVEGTIFRLGDETFLAHGNKQYSVFCSEELYSRKELRKLAKEENLTPLFYLQLGEGAVPEDAQFCITENTPHAWSSGPEIRTSHEFLDENGKRQWGAFKSLEQAREFSLAKQKHTFSESHVDTKYGVMFANPRSKPNSLR